MTRCFVVSPYVLADLKREKSLSLGQWIRRGGSRNLGRGWVREGDVPPPARSVEALSNMGILTHIHNEKIALIT